MQPFAPAFESLVRIVKEIRSFPGLIEAPRADRSGSRRQYRSPWSAHVRRKLVRETPFSQAFSISCRWRCWSVLRDGGTLQVMQRPSHLALLYDGRPGSLLCLAVSLRTAFPVPFLLCDLNPLLEAVVDG